MGIRAYVVSEYVCNYANEGSCEFNYQAEQVIEVLTDNGIDIWQASETDDYSNLEIKDLKKFGELIAKLEALPPDEEHETIEDYTNSEVAAVFKEWAKHVIDGVIRIRWF